MKTAVILNKATLKRMPHEVGTGRGYQWVERYILVSPDGKSEYYPPMTESEAKKLAEGFGWVV